MALTRITKGVIKPNENYDTNNINSTGIVTAIGLDINGNGDISGNLSVGGVLTYEDVTSIDSVGIITARNGIDCNGDIDVDGHTNLDNISVAGVTTFSNNVHVGTGITFETNGQATFSGITTSRGYEVNGYSDGGGNYNYFKAGRLKIYDNGSHIHINGTYSAHLYDHSSTRRILTNDFLMLNTASSRYYIRTQNSTGVVDLYYGGASNHGIKLSTTEQGIEITGHSELDNVNIAGVVTATTFKGALEATSGSFSSNIDANGDLDVDGHTNLDNLSVAGVSTFSGNVKIDAGTSTTLTVEADSAGVAMVKATGGSGAQATAAFELVQSTTSLQGGGISYNGDGSPSFASGETADATTFYRIINGSRYEVFSYPYNSDTVTFNSTVIAPLFQGNLSGTVNTAAQPNITSLGTLSSLTVSGAGSPISFTHTGGNCVTFNRNSKQLAINANYAGQNGYSNIVMTSGMDIRWTLGGIDRINFKSAGHIEPVTDSQINLGADARRFANLYADTLYGDGSNLTGISGISVANQANNRLITATGTTDALNAETALTFYQAGNDSILTIEGTNSAGHAQLTLKTGGTTDHCSINFGDSADHDAGEIRYTNSSDSMNFDTAGAARMILDSSGNLYPNTTDSQSLGQSSARWKNLFLGQGGQIQIGDATSTNWIGITEGLANTYTDQDFISIYFRNSMRFFSNNNNERIRIHSDGDLQLYNGNIVGNSSHTMEIGDITNGAVKRIRMTQGGEVHFGDTTTSNFMGITEGTVNQFSDVDNIGFYYRNALKFFSNNNTERFVMESGGIFRPATDNFCNLGTLSYRWANIYTADLNLSNEGSKNDVDGTWGQYTIQEGEDNLYLINKRNGKKYMFVLKEVS